MPLLLAFEPDCLDVAPLQPPDPGKIGGAKLGRGLPQDNGSHQRPNNSQPHISLYAKSSPFRRPEESPKNSIFKPMRSIMVRKRLHIGVSRRQTMRRPVLKYPPALPAMMVGRSS